MESLELIRDRILSALPQAQLEIVPNGSANNPASLRVDAAHALAVAQFLRDDPALRLDYASNVTGIDCPDVVKPEKVKITREYQGQSIEVEETVQTKIPGYFEVVYHLYSMALKHGPLVLRQRTGNRSDQIEVASLTPIYRGAEFQEREVYDLFGVRFQGHRDLRRLLMWEGFQDFPMRKDYVEPDDYEYEPTPHNEVLDKTRRHYPPEVNHG